jgi:hypothetical protein
VQDLEDYRRQRRPRAGINFYIRDELWDQQAMRVHMERYHPIGRMFADRYCRTDDRVVFPAAQRPVAK